MSNDAAAVTTVGAHSAHTLPVLEVRGLRKEFYIHGIGRRVPALNGVDLTLRLGEHLALVGESGAGKSTVLKCVWRSCLATAGVVSYRQENDEKVDLLGLEDRDMADLREREIGYVSQFLRPDPRRSVFEVVTRAAVRRGLSGTTAEDAAGLALHRAQVAESLWRTFPVLLSGGEQQRVNLAAGTVFPPRLLLLDEPVASLDRLNKSAVLELVEGMQGSGVSVLSVFHDLDAVRRLADRVAVLGAGTVLREGPPDEVLHG
jgi:alpha-D-ribose 1-methylphosphonate 5-triphosphate synthase subunit PhnL